MIVEISLAPVSIWGFLFILFSWQLYVAINFKLHRAFGEKPMQKKDKVGRLKYFHPISKKLILPYLLVLDLSTYQVTICWKPTFPAFLKEFLGWELSFCKKKYTIVDFLLT